MAPPHHLHGREAGRGQADFSPRVFSDDIEAWLASLPPAHYPIRSWEWVKQQQQQDGGGGGLS